MSRLGAPAVLVATVVALAAGPGVAQEELPKRIERFLNKGDEHLEGRDLERAIAQYEKAEKLAEGRYYEVLIRLARAKFEAGRYKEAVALAQRAHPLADSPERQAELALLVGRSYYESAYLLGATLEREELEAMWKQSMEVAEGFLLNAAGTAPEAVPEARYVLGRLYEARRDRESAERFYGDYLALAPDGQYAAVVEKRLGYLQDPDLDAATPRHVDEGITPPVALYAPQPGYTPEARKARIQGSVVVRAVVDRVGEVDRVELLKDLPMGLGRTALATIRRWRFEPALDADGEPVAVYYTLTVNFTLGR